MNIYLSSFRSKKRLYETEVIVHFHVLVEFCCHQDITQFKVIVLKWESFVYAENVYLKVDIILIFTL